MTTTKPEFTIDDAIEIAARAHRGQRDKGRPELPYLTHPMRVMSAFTEPTLQMIAVLHDAVEDSGGAVTLWDLADAGASHGVLAGVDAMTHRPGETNFDYWQRVKAHPDALAVKRADIADNSDESRLALLDDETADRLRTKYAKAREFLED